MARLLANENVPADVVTASRVLAKRKLNPLSENMPSRQFRRLVEQVVEVAHAHTLLSEEQYQEVFRQIPVPDDDESKEAISLAVRELGPFCDWSDHSRANSYLEVEGSPDDVHLEIQRIKDEREATLKGPEFEHLVTGMVAKFKELHEVRRNFALAMRDAETLMGFDQEVTNKRLAPLGAWDDQVIPKSIFELLPDDLTFPLRRTTPRVTPYDHRIHLLVRELVSRLDDVGCSDDLMIQHCGHVLAELLHANDEKAAAQLVLTQVTLLAEEYVDRYPEDVLGLCWLGELSCWSFDEAMAEDFAWQIMQRTAGLTLKDANKVVSFFALTTDWADSWLNFGWNCLESPRSHLGQIKSRRGDVERPLAIAVLRDIIGQGVWDTALLRSAFMLRENFYRFDPDDMPLECWVWMAENSEHSQDRDDCYYYYLQLAYHALARDTDPSLTHNVLVALLAGLLFNTCDHQEDPTIQQLLTGLTVTHRSENTAHRRQAALEGAHYIYETFNPSYLTAADRLAITKAIEMEVQGRTGVVSVESSLEGDSIEGVGPALLDQSEIYLKSQIGEAHWAKLSREAQNEFKLGEFLYIMATHVEGEGGNFDSFVFHYSKGLLAEIQESLLAPLHADKSLKHEYYTVFGQHEPPEWPQLLRLLDDLGRLTGTPYVRRLLAQRVDLRRLGEWRDFFENMRVLRNRVSHSGRRISRDEATLLHGQLLNQGIIRAIVESFPRPSKR